MAKEQNLICGGDKWPSEYKYEKIKTNEVLHAHASLYNYVY